MNSITEGKDRATPADMDGVVLMIPTSSTMDLNLEIVEASRLKLIGQGEDSRARSSIESRSDLRASAMNEAARGEQTNEPDKLVLPAYVARQWADLDASDFSRIRSSSRRETAIESIAAHMQASPEYAEEIKRRSPALAEAAKTFNDSAQQLDEKRQASIAESRAKGEGEARAAARLAVIDAAAMASLGVVRKEQSAAVLAMMAKSPEATTQADVAAARESLKLVTTASRAEPSSNRAAEVAAEVELKRPLKRPIADDDLSQAILQRYIVTHEKSGFLDKGKTEFTLRSGDKQGELAFSDSGKSITTEMQDKATIRAMVEVANAKNWKEITVSGTDEFKRSAWLEARISGIEVRGYEPREADKKMLAELVGQTAKPNRIEVVDQVQQRDSVPLALEPRRQTSGKHIDVEALTPSEKTSLDTSRAYLKSQNFSPAWTDAAVRELEKKIRGERVYIGTVLDHGKANFKFEEKNDLSYFVKLKTQLGEQTVWGKELAVAMNKPEVDNGQTIILKNTGKQEVSVIEKIFDASGKQTGSRDKSAVRNTWTAEPLSRFSEKSLEKQAALEPSMQVFDAKAPRAPAPDLASRDNAPQPNQQRAPRDR